MPHISCYFYICSGKHLLEFKLYPSHGSLLLNAVFSLVSRRFEYTDTCENVCCNIRNVKSNYFYCIASQRLPPSVRVFQFSAETSMVEEQESLGSCSLVSTILSLCPPKLLETPHYSLEMKLHSHFVLFIFKTNRDSNLRPPTQSH